MKFLKSNWSNILLLVFIILLIIPQTRRPLQVGINRIISFSPSEVAEANRNVLDDYNWKLQGLDGGRLNFYETKGEVTIVNFWATWCPPCIAEMPSFQKLYEDYGGTVNFFFVSSEETDKLQKFIETRQYALPVYQPVSMPPEMLQSNSLPTTYVISKKGEIVVAETGAANWNSSNIRDLLDQLLEEPN